MAEKATRHCRHYSWQPSTGPTCAVGVDLSTAGTCQQCMPNAAGCSMRVDYTEEERRAWNEECKALGARAMATLAALPQDIPQNSSGSLDCPNCGGTVKYSRHRRDIFVSCSTAKCCDFSGRLGTSHAD